MEKKEKKDDENTTIRTIGYVGKMKEDDENVITEKTTTTGVY